MPRSETLASRIAIGEETEILRMVAHQEEERQHDEENDARQNQHHRTPAGVGDQGCVRRKEDELARGIGRGQEPDNHPLPSVEPARGNVSCQISADKAGRQPDHQAPKHDELPRMIHQRGQREACGRHRQRRGYRAAHAEAIHRRRGERPDQAVDQQVDTDREGYRGTRPVELIFERHDQHARGRPHASSDHDYDKGQGDNDPGVMHPARG